jgi:hypothetical protein
MAMKHDDKRDWDASLADEMIGAVVVVGITYDEPEGPRMVQFYGVIEAAAPEAGVMVRLSGSREGERCRLPPDLRAFARASPGEYRLRSTGEIVADPDYLCTWRVTPPLN